MSDECDNCGEVKKKPVCLMSVTQNVINDPVLLHCMKILFNHANEQGLKGIKLRDLELAIDSKLSKDMRPRQNFVCNKYVKSKGLCGRKRN